MDTIINTPKRFKLFAAGLTLAALAITLLAVTFATDPAQAQAPPGGGGDTGGSTGGGTDVPQLCGPGQDHFPEDPDEVVSEGHYALFDAYWQPGGAIRPGALNDNLCPPAAAHTDVTVDGVTKEVTTRSPSKIDVRTTIIQVKDTHKTDVVATNAAAGTTKLSLEKYDEVRAALGIADGAPVPAGTKVWWLRLEDSALGTDPSNLVMGFSTGLLDGDHWQNPKTDEHGNHLPAFQYEMESVRVIGPNPAALPHVLTYWEPDLWEENNRAEVVWNGLDTDINSMPMEAGEYEHLEWVFTKPGTYILQVHLKGHVRHTKPSDWDDIRDGTWKALTVDETVTSEVKRFVFQVGDLHVNAQPHFGYHRSVDHLARWGTKVGAPIPVYGGDHDQLHYGLVGEGSDNFKVIPAPTDYVGSAVQLVVAEYGTLGSQLLDEPAQFDLQLRIKDKRDIENHADNVIDDVVPVRVTVTTTDPWASLKFLNENPRVGDQVKVVVDIRNGRPGRHQYKLYTIGNGGTYNLLEEAESTQMAHEFTITRAAAGSVTYAVEVHHGDNGPVYRSPLYPITWRH